jgi:hypothetical protein
MKQAQAARIFGVSHWLVTQWATTHRKYGFETLAAKRPGRHLSETGKLSAIQAKRMRGLIVGRIPDQLKLPFYLWTRAAVQRLNRA